MNFVEIEKLRVELSSILPRTSGVPKVLLLCSFYKKLLAANDNYLAEAFAVEFIKDFLNELNSFSPFYSEPEKTKDFLSILEKLREIETLFEHKVEIEKAISLITNRLEILSSSLNGKIKSPTEKGELFFPLLGTVYNSSEIINYSTIEKLTVKISRAKDKDTFVFVPSNHKKETLEEQAKISFELAKSFIGEYKHRLANHHEVLIYFENRNAEYDGRSLGVALTIGLIEAFSFHYNLPYITHIKSNVVSTGGVCKNGKLQQLGKEVTEKKVEAVFYSAHEIVILPKADEQTATEKLNELKEKYPQRVLRITAVESLEDLLARRNLIEFKKQPKVVRAARAAKKNWIATTLFLLLTLILVFFYVREFDDNPAILEAQENTMFVKNKSGKILWTRAISYSKQDNIYKVNPNFYHIIEDINNDGINEVIVSQETFTDSLSHLRSRIACFDNKGILLWQSMFKDTVRTKFEIIEPVYNSRLIGIVNEGKRKVLLCSATNGSNFPSAVFKLDAQNGNRIEGTLWNPGHIMMGLIREKENNQHEIVCNMYNNDYERTGIFGIDYENLSGTAPNVKEKYKLLGLKNAKLNFYLLVPNTDYNKFYNNRNNTPALAIYNEKRFDAITFSTYESASEEQISVGYEYKNRTSDINVVIISYFKARRDSLVAHGKLNPPYTDTPEYMALLKSQVLYWNGKEFVKRKELK